MYGRYIGAPLMFGDGYEPACPADMELVSSAEMPQATLPNSKILASLDSHLSYLGSPERSAVIVRIEQHLELFSDVPTCTNPVKRQLLREEVTYMLDHGIAEPSCSAWSSPCLLVGKA